MVKLGGVGVIRAIARGVKHDGFFVHPAEDAIRRLMSALSVPELNALLDDSVPEVRDAARHALDKRGDQQRERL